MTPDGRLPAPPVTITNPQTGTPLRPPLDRRPPDQHSPRRRWSLLERSVATAVVLLVLVGIAVSADLRRQQHVRAELTGLQLRATVAGIELREDSLRARLLLFPDSPVALDLRAVALDAGWVLAPDAAPLPSRLDARSARSFVLRHDLDCRTPLRPPASVRLTVHADGVASRVLQATIVQPDDNPGPSPLELACGTLPPENAVTLLASSIARGPRDTTIVLRLTNRSTRDVLVDAVTYAGFALRADPALPLTLPGRRPVLGTSRALERLLTLHPVVRDCAAARNALVTARRTSPPDLLPLDLSTPAMTKLRASVRVALDVAGLSDYLEQERLRACR